MSVLDPRELEASPLADLHTLASELGIEGYRRLRREDLVREILGAQGGASATDADADAAPAADDDEAGPEPAEESEPQSAPRRRRGLRGRVGRRGAADREEPSDDAAEGSADGGDPPDEPASATDPEAQEERLEAAAGQEDDSRSADEEEVRGGILDVLPNGSGFLRAEPFRQSREDVYVSPAQIRRCELRPGDEVSGPVRPPRRNERHPSLVRVDQVNGAPAEPPAGRNRADELPAAYPTERLPAPAALAQVPFGKGSRVAIGGPPGAGATRLLREIAAGLQGAGLEVTVVLAGVRPEEVADWRALDVTVAGGSFDSPPEEHAQVAELAVQRGKRALEQGRDAAVIVDSLDALPPNVARRVFGAGRNVEGSGSLTVVASSGLSAEPHRMATTRVALEPAEGGEPRVSAAQSGTTRADLLGG